MKVRGRLEVDFQGTLSTEWALECVCDPFEWFRAILEVGMKSRKETRSSFRNFRLFSKLLASKADCDRTQVTLCDIRTDKEVITHRKQRQNPIQHFQTTIPFFQARPPLPS